MKMFCTFFHRNVLQRERAASKYFGISDQRIYIYAECAYLTFDLFGPMSLPWGALGHGVHWDNSSLAG